MLVRNVQTSEPTHTWHCPYRVLESRTLELSAGEKPPFIGVDQAASSQTVFFLREQGYIVETGEGARDCSLYLDAATLSELQNQVQLIEYVEASAAPMVRYWRWPNEARSSLCITGDLDALSLVDYASRVFTM